MQRRKKIGGITDRRFGENDPTMTPEERAMERFVREKQRGGRRGTLFDLEDEVDTEEGGLTHLGQSLSFDKNNQVDDFDEANLGLSEASDADAEGESRSRKRRRLSDVAGEENKVRVDEEEGVQEKPKTKQEVMKEVMAKSKLYKYERQKAKEDDDELRVELDQGLADIYSLLRGDSNQRKAPRLLDKAAGEIQMNPDRAALLNGMDRSQADKEYDERLRQMAFDARSKPTTRTKTEEEKLEEESRRLKELEERRLARMRGEESDSEVEGAQKLDLQADEIAEPEDEDRTGLGRGITLPSEKRELDVEDEDDFILDDDLIASDSNAEVSEDDGGSKAPVDVSPSDDEREFVEGLLSKDDVGRDGFDHAKGPAQTHKEDLTASGLAFTYPCPQTHDELLQITESAALQDLPIIVQRIRALYHPKLNAENKAKLGSFSAILVDHLSYLANQTQHPPFSVLESLIRHTHSLAKSFPEEVGLAFRKHLKAIQDERPTSFTSGDLVLLTSIASIFPTSDHFHQVVTPAMLSMARYLGQDVPQTLGHLVKGTYVQTLCIQYQRLSKRYIPELVNYNLNALSILAPEKPKQPFGPYPSHKLPTSLRLAHTENSIPASSRTLQFWDVEHVDAQSSAADEELKTSLLETNIRLITPLATLWSSKSAFPEIFTPYHNALTHLSTNPLHSAIQTLVAQTLTHLTPLLHRPHPPLRLHHHRPLAIQTSVPKFEESYNPSKRYDPDRDRAEVGKLKAEYKREKKGAMRELRKDASFMAREGLREKKEADREYEKKYRRLVAEVQGEEGREAKAYEREVRGRKGAKRGGRGR